MASGSPTSEQVHNAFQSCRFGADEFLRTGVPISHRFTYDYLPIHYAAIEGRECLVRYSLENRIDPNSSTCYGSTALHFAAREGRLEIARLLLNHGADVNARDFNNATPLHYAVAEQRTELMELLIDYGANKRAENVRRTTLSPAFIHSSRTHLRAIPHDSSSTKRRSTSPGTTNIATFSSLAVRRHALHSSIHPCVRHTDAPTAAASRHLVARLAPQPAATRARRHPRTLPDSQLVRAALVRAHPQRTHARAQHPHRAASAEASAILLEPESSATFHIRQQRNAKRR